jgi:hypothetical protein
MIRSAYLRGGGEEWKPDGELVMKIFDSASLPPSLSTPQTPTAGRFLRSAIENFQICVENVLCGCSFATDLEYAGSVPQMLACCYDRGSLISIAVVARASRTVNFRENKSASAQIVPTAAFPGRRDSYPVNHCCVWRRLAARFGARR